jgi:hypothetical protein
MTDLTREVFGVQVRVTQDPEGERAVLLQLPHGFVVMRPADALKVAGALIGVVDELAGSCDGS